MLCRLCGIFLLAGFAGASPIKHVVVVMLENRAFDHLFGWATDLLGVNGLTGKETNPTSTEDPHPMLVPVTKNSPYVGPCDPNHGFPATTDKIYGQKQVDSGHLHNASMIGFVEYEAKHKDYCGVMDMFTPEQLPVITKLAQEYAIMDRFFCSHPGPTWPNRLFTLAGTSGGLTETTNPAWYHGKPGKFFPMKTIFDQVEEAGLEWKNYYSDTPWETFLEKLALNPEKLQDLDYFFDDCRTGNLPAYSWINPRLGVNLTSGVGSNDQHPDHDMRAGEVFLKDIYDAVRSSPAWNETLLVITYDEHGGFYDHVAPPTGVPPPDSETSYPDNFAFDRLGIRIPTILVSPWITKGTVVSKPPAAQKPAPNSEYDLTSILATSRKLLGISEVPLTARDAWSATFEHVIGDKLRDDCPMHMPDPPLPEKTYLADEAAAELNELQIAISKNLAHLNGVKPPKLFSQGEVGPWVQAAFQNHHSRETRKKALSAYSLAIDMCNGVAWLETSWNIGLAPHAHISTTNLKVSNMSLCLETKSYSVGTEIGVGVCTAGDNSGFGLGVNRHWSLEKDATLRPLQNSSLCLTSHAYLPGTDKSPKATLEVCSGAVQQHFAYSGSLAPGAEGHGQITIFSDQVCVGIRKAASAEDLEVI